VFYFQSVPFGQVTFKNKLLSIFLFEHHPYQDFRMLNNHYFSFFILALSLLLLHATRPLKSNQQFFNSSSNSSGSFSKKGLSYFWFSF